MNPKARRLLRTTSIAFLVLGFFVTVALFVVLSWPRHFPYDANKVDCRLAGLSEPYQHIHIVGYDRPNTIGVAIFDARSIRREFCIQYSPSAAHQTPVIILGGPSIPDRPESIAENYGDTRNRILTIMYEHGRLDRVNEKALATLTGSWLDSTRYHWCSFRDDSIWLFRYLVFDDKGT